MSLQERTLVIKNFDPDRTTDKILRELCIQGGPVRNVVVRTDHAFIEYEDVESVGYSKALLEGVRLFGKRLSLEPKLRRDEYYKFSRAINDYINYDKHCRALAQQQQQQQQQMQLQLQLQQQQQQQFNSFPVQQQYQPPTQPNPRSHSSFKRRRR